MTLLGLSDSRIAALVEPIIDGNASDGLAVEAFARAAWSCIVEPGDGAAGGVVTAVGAVAALGVLSSGGQIRRLRSLCESLERDDVADAVVAAWSSGVGRWSARLDSAAVMDALHLARATGVRFALPGSPSWPTGLADLGVHAPIGLWVRGRPLSGRLDRSVALVGARAATGYGEHITLESASGLVDRGFAIVSGAAYGIDGAAHRGALADGGATVAFLAGGLDRPYPSGHASLISRIAQTGAVYAEVPCGHPPTKWRFLQRNRLIAAASSATVVLEAGARSGSLNTAGHAASLGRPLGAVPGPITSAASAGCHRLLREYDATCVTSAEEMAELAAPGLTSTANDADGPSSAGASATDRVFRALGRRRASTVLDLVATTGLTMASVQSALGLLDLDGAAAERNGGWVRT